MSSYQVIARRYRPQQFADVIGQEHVTRVLEGAIRSARVAHAYLFCGPRGVGKTSTARILARALNCEQGPTPTPCNSCQICEEITAGRNLDTIEIDGASTRGIDSARELRENARYAPVGGRRKIYVIDEVHMLTTEAFNALLKTLEEPPPHVVFIFATTDPQKVPATILSRCQRFDFRRLKVQEIAEHLGSIVASEKFTIDPAALMVVARRGQGSMRDAESLLDQIMVAIDGEKEVTRENVERLLGLTSSETYLELTDCLKRQDAAGALTVLESSLAAGNHLDELTNGLIDHLRNLTLLAVSSELAPATGLSSDLIERCQEQLDGWSRGDLARLVDLATGAAAQMRRSDFPRLHLEMALVRMAELPATADLKELVQRLGGTPGEGPPAPAGGGRGGRSGRAGSGRGGNPGGGSRGGRGGGGRRAAPRAATDDEAPIAAAGASARPPVPSAGLALVPTAGGAVAQAEEAEEAEEAAAADARAATAATPSGPVPDIGVAWQRIVERVRGRKTYLGSLLSEAPGPVLHGDVLRLCFAADQGFHLEQVNEVHNRDLILEELRVELGAGTRLRVEKASSTESPATAPTPAARVPLQFTREVERLVNRVDGIILPDSSV